MSKIDLTPIVQAVITLASLLITAYLVPFIKAKLTAAQQEKVQKLVEIAVKAAEQIYSGSGQGDEKLAYVQEYLAGKGINIDLAQIEATVKDLFNSYASVQEGLYIEE